ncbi:MAG: hypothetical protein JXB13_11435 [Phycisphaerae bacterium]|nr:hypothetical protein [Phycisphaerae bacterium]
MFRLCKIGVTAVAALAWVSVSSAAGDEDAIVANIEAFLKTSDIGQRREIVDRIEADPAYDRKCASEWLHRADVFPTRQPGIDQLSVPLADGTTRAVALRIPKGYDARQPWPLIYALHGANGKGEEIIGYVTRVLGDDADKFVIAAPTGYEEIVIHHGHWPPTGEHPTVLLAIKHAVHVNSDRVYVIGYSRGGHAAWTLAVLHADQFAGAMPLAGTFSLVYVDLLWDAFLPNLAHLPVLCVWGAGDTSDGGDKPSKQGGIAGLNRALRERSTRPETTFPLVGIEDPERGHSDVVPPPDEVRTLLARTRVHNPPVFHHAFRHICQAQAYWVEGHRWYGDQWDQKRRNVRIREGEVLRQDELLEKSAAIFRRLLGYLEGSVDGQVLSVGRKNVDELTVWIHDGMIDWEQPIVLKVSGRQVFEGRVEPDLLVCLTQAGRTWDFDRLRWAGLRFKGRSKTRPVTAETEFPTLSEQLAERK